MLSIYFTHSLHRSVLHCPPRNPCRLHTDSKLATDSEWSPSSPHGVCRQSKQTQLGQVSQVNFHHKGGLSEGSPSRVLALLDLVKFLLSAHKITLHREGFEPQTFALQVTWLPSVHTQPPEPSGNSKILTQRLLIRLTHFNVDININNNSYYS
jgi:hypothetical protein